jgi:MFS family permease
MLDGFESATSGLLLGSVFSELLPLSRLEASTANIALYGGYGFANVMSGWACSMFWAWLADRIGRVRTMCLTIIVYSIFTALSGATMGVVSFLVLRFLVGVGIGGEWVAGTPLLHESVPEPMRVRLAGGLHTATPVGIMFASAPALLVVPWLGSLDARPSRARRRAPARAACDPPTASACPRHRDRFPRRPPCRTQWPRR